MAQFPGFGTVGGRDGGNGDVGMADVEDDESSSNPSTNESFNTSVSRTADHFGTALRISPPRLSIPNPLRNYFAVSAAVDPNFFAPPLPPDDDMATSSSSSSAPAGPPQALPMTPVYFPPPNPATAPAAAPPPAAAPVSNYQFNNSSSSSFAAAPAPVQQKDTPRPKAPARNKVPLEKGYSQMVWLRLMQSEPDLAGLKGESSRRLLTMEEIKKHQSEGEAWTILRGRVYNVTPYLKFHPGGPEMLMKAAGKDGTALFNKYHAWVNAEFLLEKCMVGLLDVQGQGTFESPSGLSSM
ncbi:unnamed protein product [Calypogeia fissa]